jgi:large subunit ribosomal protein L13
MIVINGENKVFGRLCSEVAEKLIKYNEKIVVVNTRKTIMSGSSESIFERVLERTERGGKGNPRNQPKYPRYPDRLVKRGVRGMLPRKPRGAQVLKNLIVHIDVPDNFAQKIPVAVKLKNIEFLTLETISKKLGAKYSN